MSQPKQDQHHAHWLRSDGQQHLQSGKFLSGDNESGEASNSNPRHQTHPPEPRVGWFGGQTALQGLLAAVALPQALVNVSDVIDNTWSVVLQRADKAGRLLAQVPTPTPDPTREPSMMV
jgi:hypothetical protein